MNILAASNPNKGKNAQECEANRGRKKRPGFSLIEKPPLFESKYKPVFPRWGSEFLLFFLLDVRNKTPQESNPKQNRHQGAFHDVAEKEEA